MSGDGLPLGYRIWWKLRRSVLSVFGPAQLGDDDPGARLDAERAAKIAQIKAAKGQADKR